MVLFGLIPCVKISHELRVENGECQQVVVGDSEHWDVVSEQAFRVEVGSEERCAHFNESCRVQTKNPRINDNRQSVSAEVGEEMFVSIPLT